MRPSESATDATLDAVLGPFPDVAAELARAHEAAWNAVDPELLELCRLRLSTLLGSPGVQVTGLDGTRRDALASWPTADVYNAAERACLAFTEQFVIDVASLDDSLATAVTDALGGSGFVDFVQGLLVVEQRERLALGWQRLGLADADDAGPAADGQGPRTRRDVAESLPDRGLRVPEGSRADEVLSAALGEWQAAAVRLDEVDPITTELVRLRCARHHDCHT